MLSEIENRPRKDHHKRNDADDDRRDGNYIGCPADDVRAALVDREHSLHAFHLGIHLHPVVQGVWVAAVDTDHVRVGLVQLDAHVKLLVAHGELMDRRDDDKVALVVPTGEVLLAPLGLDGLVALLWTPFLHLDVLKMVKGALSEIKDSAWERL